MTERCSCGAPLLPTEPDRYTPGDPNHASRCVLYDRRLTDNLPSLLSALVTRIRHQDPNDDPTRPYAVILTDAELHRAGPAEVGVLSAMVQMEDQPHLGFRIQTPPFVT